MIGTSWRVINVLKELNEIFVICCLYTNKVCDKVVNWDLIQIGKDMKGYLELNSVKGLVWFGWNELREYELKSCSYFKRFGLKPWCKYNCMCYEVKETL